MDSKKLMEILIELRSASLQMNLSPTEESVKSLMNKYDMLFLGKNFNTIYSLELMHSINTVFNLCIDNSELNELLPNVCKALNMKCEPMIAVTDVSKSNPPIHCYTITL